MYKLNPELYESQSLTLCILIGKARTQNFVIVNYFDFLLEIVGLSWSSYHLHRRHKNDLINNSHHFEYKEFKNYISSCRREDRLLDLGRREEDGLVLVAPLRAARAGEEFSAEAQPGGCRADEPCRDRDFDLLRSLCF